MAEKTSVIAVDGKGQFQVPVPRAAIERIDIIDIDMVLQTKSGERLILPGAGIEAMTNAPPAVSFSDGRASTADLLSAVDKVETPPTSIPAMTSLTEFDQKKTEGKKNRTADDPADQAVQEAQEAQAQQVAPLPVQGSESAVDKLVEKAEAMEADIRKKAFDPAPAQVYEPPPSGPDAPPGQPNTYKIPMYVSLAEGNVVNTTANQVGNTFYGSGGPSGSALADGILAGDAKQYGTETLTGTAAPETFYADGFYKASGTWATTGANLLNDAAAYAALDNDTGRAPTGTAFYYAKEVQLNVAGYVRSATSVTVSGLPDGVSIEGGTQNADGTWSIPVGSVFPTSSTLTLVYDVTKMHALTSTDVFMAVRIVGVGTEAFDITRTFVLRFADISDSSEVTTANPVYIAGSGWSDVYVMPTASAPHVINAGDGDNLVYAGNSADTITAGTGADVIRAYAGNDIVSAGAGDNTVYAGDGNDQVVTAGDDDLIAAGSGDDYVYAGAGTNNVDGGAGTDWMSFNGVDASLLSGSLSATQTLEKWLAHAGTDISGVSFVATDTSGSATTTRAGGSDTVVNIENLIGSQGNDTLDLSAYTGVKHILYGLDGNDVIKGADGADTLYGGAGDDSILGGVGDDLIFTAITSTETTVSAAALAGTAQDGSGAGSLSATAAATGGGVTFTQLTNVVDGGAGADTVVGGAGADYFIAHMDEHGTDTVRDSFVGGAGIDTLDMSDYTTSLSVTLSETSGTAQEKGGTTYYANFAGIERIVTGSGADEVTGSGADATTGWTGADIIYTGQGNDTIYSGTGNDIVHAGDGSDTLYSEGGNDSLYGETGNDTFYGYGGTSVLADTATIVMNGGDGSNTYYLYGATESVVGTDGIDTVSYWNGYSRYGVTSGSTLVDISGTSTRVYLGIFANLSTTDYGIDSSGNLVSGAASSYWRTGSTDPGSEWLLMGAGTNGYQWQADNDQRGFYANAEGDRYFGVENIVGTNYSDVLIGNNSDNVITGNGGNDALYGLGGDDTFANSQGTSVYIDGGTSTATAIATGTGVTSSAFTGGDTVNCDNHQVGYTVTLVADGSLVAGSMVSSAGVTSILYGIENYIGGNSADVITGTSANNYLVGGGGNDTINGDDGDDVINLGYSYSNSGLSPNSGADTADGGAGNDWVSYLGLGTTGTAGVTIHLDTGRGVAGYDQYSKSSNNDYDDLKNFEHAQGSNYADIIYGSSVANTLWGMAGNDTLYGLDGDDIIDGGSGNDTMVGGSGNDTYYVDSNSDVVSELAGEGIDTVYTTATFTLSSNIEVLTATGTSNANLTGNELDNTITGNSGNNSLNGGAGADAMTGGDGNDTYFVDNVGDSVVEQAGEGTDTVYTSIDYTLGANVEHLRAWNTSGLTLTGNALGNSIVGSSGADMLYGDDGDDSIDGGNGNDIIEGGVGADSMYGNSGTDTLSYASSSAGVTVDLGAGTASGGDAEGDVFSSFENLSGSAHADILTGTTGTNVIHGDSGNDVITGGGGTDTLYGDAGSDTLQLTTGQLNSYVYGGSGNAAGNATEDGTDTLQVTGWNLGGNLINRLNSIEVIDVRDSTINSTSAISYSQINNILADGASGGKLVLYLDNGDTFTHTNSTDGNGGDTLSNTTVTYTYSSGGGGNSHQVEVHWG